MEYDIKCPKCGVKAVARMKAHGTKGTYREATVHLVAERLLCPSCGFNRSASPEKPLEYDLWYKRQVRGNALWAVNLQHITFLIRWLSDAIPPSELSAADRAYVETLPKWMIDGKNRPAVLKKLEAMRTS